MGIVIYEGDLAIREIGETIETLRGRELIIDIGGNYLKTIYRQSDREIELARWELEHGCLGEISEQHTHKIGRNNYRRLDEMLEEVFL